MTQPTRSRGDKTLMCRFCKVPPELHRVEAGSDRIVCPKCDRYDSLDVARRMALQYAEGEIVDSVQEMIRRTFARSQHIRHVPGRRKHRVRPRVFMYL